MANDRIIDNSGKFQGCKNYAGEKRCQSDPRCKWDYSDSVCIDPHEIKKGPFSDLSSEVVSASTEIKPISDKHPDKIKPTPFIPPKKVFPGTFPCKNQFPETHL